MKQKHVCLFGAALAVTFVFSSFAQAPAGATPKPLGAEKTSVRFVEIEIKNLQDESLGRIVDLGVDLVNGRIVEVLIESDSSLGVEGKIVAVPPLALVPDLSSNRIYRLDVTTELFKTAAAIDFTKWRDAGRTENVAAAYHLFGQEPYFLEKGGDASMKDHESKVWLGYVERVNKLTGMPVGNFQGQKFGEVWSLTMNIPRGRVLNVIVIAPGNFETKSVVPPMALSFNEKRDALLIDDSVEEFADEPRYLYTAAAYGNAGHSQEEGFKGPRTYGPLEQGDGHRDIMQRVAIYKGIRAAKANGRHVQIGVVDGRITLRGWTYSAEDKQEILEVAINAATLEMVDDQLTVGRPVAGK